MRYFTRIIYFSAISVLCWSARASAATSLPEDTLIEGAKLCTQYLPRHERQYGIPLHLLAAIASTESGRYHHALGLNLPWPWTINVEGKGYFFPSKQEAVAAVQKLQARGLQSIDVGCMQVNLMHHPHAFASLDQAFDPAYNIAYAAQFLKQNYADEGSWRKATGDYHSHTPSFGAQYASLVFGAWERIINKVADARAGRPLLNAHARKAEMRFASSDAVEGARSHVRLRSMSLASERSTERGVLVIRPNHEEPAAEQINAASDKKLPAPDEFITKNVESAAKSGPQIVTISAGKALTSTGQFQPEAKIVKLATTEIAAKEDKPAPAKNMFVFDN